MSRRDVLSNVLALAAATLVPSTLSTLARAQQAGAGPRTAAQAGPGTVAGTGPATTTVPGGRPGPRPGTWLVLLGTRGGPGVEASHAQTSSAVVVDGRPYLIDCGYGAVRNLAASNVGLQQIGTVFFTHLHDDHTGDLAALLSYQWTGGKTTPTDAYGPYGTEHMVKAAVEFFRANVEIRTADEGRTVDASNQFHGHDVPATDSPTQIFKDDRLTVTAIENTHYPERSKAKMPYRSIALRLDTKDRSIVFSGDTAYSANIVKLAKNADLFVCEIIDETVLEQVQKRAKEDLEKGNTASISRHVADTHSSPTDVARMASEAKVKTVVLYHQVGGAFGSLSFPVSRFIDAIHAAGFGGEVIVGQDLMVL